MTSNRAKCWELQNHLSHMYSLLRRRAEYLVLNKGDKISTDFRLCKILMRIYSHMSNTLNQIPVDKTWSPTESSRKMKPEVQ